MMKYTLPLLLLAALALAACRPETPLGGPPTPAQAVMVTEPAAEILESGTTLNLVESPARKITGAIDAGASLTYTLVVEEGAAAEFTITTPLEEMVFSLMPPDGVTLSSETTDIKSFTETIPAAGEYTLEISNNASDSGTFMMDVRINQGMESTAP